MFGGIAALGSDTIVYATSDGHIVRFDANSGVVTGQQALYPVAPRRLHVAASAFDDRRDLLVADARHGLVRVVDPDGCQRDRIGGLATPGVQHEDAPGVLHEPCDLLWTAENRLWIVCGGYELEHAVQCFDRDGKYLFSAQHPDREWVGACGIARVGDAIWIAETERGAIRRCDLDGQAIRQLRIDPDLARPFRLAGDGHDGAFVIFAPFDGFDDGPEEPFTGVARLGPDGAFRGWDIQPGESAGQVASAFDITVLDDGRFVVADLPLGVPPDVRIQLFEADGRLAQVLLEDADHLNRLQKEYFESLLGAKAEHAQALYDQARVHHYHGGGSGDHVSEAARLYREALERDPGHLLAHLGLATLLEESLDDPAAAEREYERAIGVGGEEAEMRARIAECRHRGGDVDGAIRILQAAVEGTEFPEEYHDRVETLGTWFLERAGHASDAVI
jgi:hypothetical protein